jgi:predicted exporter
VHDDLFRSEILIDHQTYDITALLVGEGAVVLGRAVARRARRRRRKIVISILRGKERSQ